MLPTLTEASIAFAVLSMAAAVHGSVGFGGALIAAPVLLLLDPVYVPGPMLIASLVLTSMLAIRDRKGMDVRGVGWALLGRVPGTLLGLLCLDLAPAEQLPRVLAGFILLAVVLSAGGVRIRPRPVTLGLAGVLSGLMGTVASIGGPPIALIYQHAGARALRGTLAGYIMLSTLISITALALFGLLGKRELVAAATLLPGILVGFVISNKTRRLLEGARVRPAVLAVTALAALTALVRYS